MGGSSVEDAAHGVDIGLPLAGAFLGFLNADGGEVVDAPGGSGGLDFPGAVDEVLGFEGAQGGVQGAFFEVEGAGAEVGDGAGDAVAVEWAAGEDGEDEGRDVAALQVSDHAGSLDIHHT